MIRTITLGALFLLAALVTAGAQDSRPASRPSSRPASRPSSLQTRAEVSKKWLDELAKPIKIGPGGRWAEYGSSIKLKTQTSLKAVANNPDRFGEKTLLVRGSITGICVKKGCWIKIKDSGEELFVKFKDYSFFAPRHLEGYDALLEGRISVDIVKEAERRHMAEDAGKSKEEIEKIKGDAKELRMMAHAMRIIEPAQPRQARMTLIGEHDNRRSLTPLEKVASDSKSYQGKDIDVVGQIVEVKPDYIIIESAGKRLTARFTDPRPDARTLLLLKNSGRACFLRGFGTISHKDGEVEMAVKSAAIIH